MPEIIANLLKTFPAAHLLQVLSALPAAHVVVGLAVSASLVVILEDWRWSLLCLLAQYVLAGLLLSAEVLPSLALIKILVGAIATLSLYWTARAITLSVSAKALSGGEIQPAQVLSAASMRRPLRALAVVMAALAVSALQVRFPIPTAPAYVNAGAYWLLGMGLTIMMLTQEPFKMGMGLLMFQSGFELLYTSLEPSLVVTGLTGLVTLLTSLLIAYLTAAKMMPWLEQDDLPGSVLDRSLRALSLGRYSEAEERA
jgi:hypothetical protein